ncbi:MAG: alpha/beta fold hydrolase [Bacteroidales bacterium]
MLGHRLVGNGAEAVVVLHEWLGDHGNYDDAMPYLAADSATYVFADFRGYGLSRDMSGAYTMTEACDDVLALMDALGHQRFHVVGHSMSGMVAQYLALTRPDRVKSIVAISPVPATGFKADDAARARLRAVITDDDSLRAAVTVRTGNRYGRGWLDRKLALARRARPEAMLGYLDMFTGTDFAERMAGLNTPAALVTGANDIAFYRRATLEPGFRRAFARLDVAEVADAGHYSMVETPILLAALIERAVTGQPLSRTGGTALNGGAAFQTLATS